MRLPLLLLLAFATATAQAADPSEGLFDLADLRVRITETLPYLELGMGKGRILLMRHQDPDHIIASPYNQTARDCPPYCVQPMHLAPGVETIGELELIDYLRRAAAGEPVLVIDSRTPSWTVRGMIPGALEIPYTRLDPAVADPGAVAESSRSNWSRPRGWALELRERQDPGALLQRRLVRPVAHQHPVSAQLRLSGPQA